VTAEGDRAANIAALECVRQLVQADHRRDLLRYRARLHDDLVIRVGDAVIARGADDAALLAAREWALAPDSTPVVDDLGVASGMVTVRYRITAGLVPGSDGPPRNLAGYSIFEVDGDKVIRIWHHLQAVEG
jgi:hypothetical protein